MSELTGDFNDVGITDITDVQYLLNWLSAGGNNQLINTEIEYRGFKYIINNDKVLRDTNGDGIIDINDVQYLLNWLSAGGNASLIGQYLPYRGRNYIVDYITSPDNWNSLINERQNSKYRFFIEIYNIPKGTQSIIANIKENDGLIIKNNDINEQGKISSKSTIDSGFFTSFNTTEDVRLSTDGDDLFKYIIINDDTFYHKSLSVPMNSSFTKLEEIILYIFLQGHSYNTALSNTGIMARLNLDSLGNNNLFIHNNETVVLDHHGKKIYHRNSANQVNSIDLTSLVSNGVLFS